MSKYNLILSFVVYRKFLNIQQNRANERPSILSKGVRRGDCELDVGREIDLVTCTLPDTFKNLKFKTHKRRKSYFLFVGDTIFG